MPSVEQRLQTLETTVERHERILCRLIKCVRAVWPVIGTLITGLIAKHVLGH